MSQNKQISQFLNSLLADDLSKANSQLKAIVERKQLTRIRNIDAQLEEGLFDRLGAQASGMKANLGARAANFGTKVGGGLKAAGQALGGNFKGAASSLNKAQATAGKNDAKVAGELAQAKSITNSMLGDLKKLYPTENPVDILQAVIDDLKSSKPTFGTPVSIPKPKVKAAAPARKPRVVPMKSFKPATP